MVQLHELLLPLIARVRPQLGPLRELQRVKFLGRIVPGDEITVTLRFAGDQPNCDFELTKPGTRCSRSRSSASRVL